jgi:ATP-dependent RNA helicase RhlE
VVLDEADRMLDMGFIHDVRRIMSTLPRERQTLLFSATMPREIEQLARTILRRPEHVAVDPVSSTCEPIAQSVFFVEQRQKLALLVQTLRRPEVDRVLVFTRTKHGANRVASGLESAGIGAAAIHGNKSQSARERALAGFKSGATPVIVATDLASRGLDVKAISHVINYDLPNEPEVYVHRVGRTGRAGASGVALSFCSREERPYLTAIERLTGADIRRQTHDLPPEAPLAASRPSGRTGRPAPNTMSRNRPARPQRHRAGATAY